MTAQLATPPRTTKSLVALWLVTLVLSTFGWFAAFITVPTLFGWQAAVVISGSMRPRIQPGDVVLMPAYDHHLAVGQVVNFRSIDHPGETITHRLRQHNTDGSWTTQGDANATADSTPLTDQQVVGKPQLLVPYAGILTYWRSSKQNNKLAATLLGVITLMAAMVLLNRSAPGQALNPVLGAPTLPADLVAAIPPVRPARFTGSVVVASSPVRSVTAASIRPLTLLHHPALVWS